MILYSLITFSLIPLIVTSSTDILVGFKGEKITLNCTDSGVAAVTWFRMGKEIIGEKGFEFVKNTVKFNIDKSTFGIYTCKYGSTSQNFTVNVIPHIDTEMKSEKNTIQDEVLVIECKGFGYPKPIVYWTKDSITLDYNVHRITLKNGDDMINSTIRMRDMTKEDAGEYICTANNTFGNVSFVVTVNVKDKFAALWPFLAICAEVAILCTIIFIYEKRRSKQNQEDQKEEADHLNAQIEGSKIGDEVRQRK